MHILNKIIKSDDISSKIQSLRKNGKRIVFTNGCFDILHAGHVRYLAAAGAEGDILIVGLNSDKSVKLIKGNKRPIISQAQRAEVLAALEPVNYVTIFNEPDPFKLICRIKPDVLVKGADWEEKDIIGADIVKKNGGKIVRVDIVQQISTSDIIQRIMDTMG
ncbi:MAG: D-glycero-beta-D-manno-heptose 1-phosphate adenylyltransferase [Deltaproteobacteria bacterium]|nr:D-glycero-beta-D-manno-heptose 1-phosphate adenylyltransferase [Deltaproteobacteria bacterium]